MVFEAFNNGKKGPTTFCSKKCRERYQRRKIRNGKKFSYTCLNCNQEQFSYYQKRQFCNILCQTKYFGRRRKLGGSRMSRWKDRYRNDNDFKREHNQQGKKWRLNNSEKVKETARKIKQSNRLLVINHYSKENKCVCCGESNIKFLTIDHINNNGAEHRKQIKNDHLAGWLVRNNYPEGFQILCWNCNEGKKIYKICPHKGDTYV